MIFDEVVSWLGNGIFFIGQLTQVLHVQETKSCKDISYLSLFLALTGNVLFTAYGFGSKSPSMFIGMGVATMMSLYQLYQKHTFDQENTENMFIKLDEKYLIPLPDAIAPEFLYRSRSNTRDSPHSPRETHQEFATELAMILEKEEQSRDWDNNSRYGSVESGDMRHFNLETGDGIKSRTYTE